jgi:hypothetical protein
LNEGFFEFFKKSLAHNPRNAPSAAASGSSQQSTKIVLIDLSQIALQPPVSTQK